MERMVIIIERCLAAGCHRPLLVAETGVNFNYIRFMYAGAQMNF
jgi:hypothetical protein